MARQSKKTNIVRVRTGCYTCRRRRMKCDEAKPQCRACIRLGVECEGYYRVTFRDDTAFISEKVITNEAKKREGIRAQGSQQKRRRTESEASSSNLQSRQQISSIHDGSSSNSFPAAALSQSSRMQADSRDSNTDPIASGGNISAIQSRVLGLDQILSVPITEISNKHQPYSYPNHVRHQSHAQSISSSPTQYHDSPDGAVPISTWSSLGSESMSDTFSNGFSSSSPSSLATSITAYSRTRLGSSGSTISHPPGSEFEDDMYTDITSSPLMAALPAIFKELIHSYRTFTVFRYAILALALAEKRHISAKSPPNYAVQSNALKYYSSALLEFSKDGPNAHFSLDAHVKLAVLILFAYFETKWGTYIGGITHMIHADELVEANIDGISRTKNGRDLICAWHSLRSLYALSCCCWAKVSFRTYFFDKPIWSRVQGLVLEANDLDSSMLELFTEAARVSTLIIIGRTVGIDSSSSSKYGPWVDRLKAIDLRLPDKQLYDHGSEADMFARLDNLRSQLDTWHARLPMSALPIDSFTSTSIENQLLSTTSSTKIQIQHPLRFESHSHAMTYARYACAQLLCSRRSIDHCSNPNPPSTASSSNPLDSWTQLILRITSGLSPRVCEQLNSHNIGILWILTAVAQRNLSIPVIEWIDSWLRHMHDQGVYQETSTPLGLIRDLIELCRRELVERGRGIFYTNFGYKASKEKLDLYGEEGLTVGAVLYGKVMRTGELFTDLVMKL